MSELRSAGVPNLFIDLDSRMLKVKRKINGKVVIQTTEIRMTGARVPREAIERRDEIMGVKKTDVPSNKRIRVDDGFKAVIERRRKYDDEGNQIRKKGLADTTVDTYRGNWKNHVSDRLKRKRVADVTTD